MWIFILLACGILITDDDTGPLITVVSFVIGSIGILAILNGYILW